VSAIEEREGRKVITVGRDEPKNRSRSHFRAAKCYDSINDCSAIDRIGEISNNSKCFSIQAGRELAGIQLLLLG
jgi:hypothetical protein